MSGFELSLDIEGIDAVKRNLKGFFDKQAPKAAERALNKTLKSSKSEASKLIRKEITAKKKYVDRTMRVYKASAKHGRLTASLVSTGKSLPMIAYQTRQTKKGVSVKVEKGGKRSTIPHAFIATMPTGHKGVFQRKIRHPDHYDQSIPFSKKGRKRPGPQWEKIGRMNQENREYILPIKEKFSPSVPSIFRRPDLMARLKKQAQARLKRNFEYALGVQIERL